MRFYPDKWELGVVGHQTLKPNNVDKHQDGYDSEAEARKAWRQMRPGAGFVYTLAVIYPPVGSERKPIVLKDTNRIMKRP